MATAKKIPTKAPLKSAAPATQSKKTIAPAKKAATAATPKAVAVLKPIKTAFNKTGLVQATLKAGNVPGPLCGRPATEKPEKWHRRLGASNERPDEKGTRNGANEPSPIHHSQSTGRQE